MLTVTDVSIAKPARDTLHCLQKWLQQSRRDKRGQEVQQTGLWCETDFKTACETKEGC